MKRRIISQNGKPAFVVIPIDEWRRIESALGDHSDAAAVPAFQKNPSETYPDSVVEAILDGADPIKTFRDYRRTSSVQRATKKAPRKTLLRKLRSAEASGVNGRQLTQIARTVKLRKAAIAKKAVICATIAADNRT